MPGTLTLVSRDLQFEARLETDRAPRTCAAILSLLPLHTQIIQARWSGQAAWVPLGDLRLDIGAENPTHHPQAGEILFYPGGISEAEVLVPYGRCAFGSEAGPLAGNHFLTITKGHEQLQELGRRVLWEGAQPLVIALKKAPRSRMSTSAGPRRKR